MIGSRRVAAVDQAVLWCYKVCEIEYQVERARGRG